MTAAELFSRPLFWARMIHLSSESRLYFQKLIDSAHSNQLPCDKFATPAWHAAAPLVPLEVIDDLGYLPS